MAALSLETSGKSKLRPLNWRGGPDYEDYIGLFRQLQPGEALGTVLGTTAYLVGNYKGFHRIARYAEVYQRLAGFYAVICDPLLPDPESPDLTSYSALQILTEA